MLLSSVLFFGIAIAVGIPLALSVSGVIKMSPHQVLFGAGCAGAMLSIYIGTAIIYYPLLAVGVSKRTTESYCCVYAGIVLKVMLACCFWIKIKTIDGKPLRYDLVTKSTKAPFWIMNHSSFFDFFLFSSSYPTSLMLQNHLRTMIKAGLFKMPVYGPSVGTRCGSFPVHFKKDDEGSFSVDREKQAPVTQAIESHIAQGGAIGICPEGQIGSNPPNLQPFRRGSFATPIMNDMDIFGFTMIGCWDTWGRKEPIGGHATTIYVKVELIYSPAKDELAADVAQKCQDRMQKTVDELTTARNADLGIKN